MRLATSFVTISVGLALTLQANTAARGAEAAAGTKAPPVKIASTSAPAAATASTVPEPPVTQAAKPRAVKPKARHATLVARIDLASQRMHVTANGKAVGNWKISSGTIDHKTPPGRFRPQWSSKMHYSKTYDNAPMPYAVFFNRGIATHGTNAVSRLGQPASHGCIRLRTANARRFYNLVHRHGYKGTKIIVSGTAPYSRTASRQSTRTHRASPRRANKFVATTTARRSNAYNVDRRNNRRMSLTDYDRARRATARRAHAPRRMVFPGDRR